MNDYIIDSIIPKNCDIPLDHKHSNCIYFESKNPCIVCDHCFCDVCDCHYTECYNWQLHCKLDKRQETLFSREKYIVSYIRNLSLNNGIIDILSTKNLFSQLNESIKTQIKLLQQENPEVDEDEEEDSEEVEVEKECEDKEDNEEVEVEKDCKDKEDNEEVEVKKECEDDDEILSIIPEFQQVMIRKTRESPSPIPAQEFTQSPTSAFTKFKFSEKPKIIPSPIPEKPKIVPSPILGKKRERSF